MASPTGSAPATGAATVATASTDLGTILVDGAGMTLYMFTKDTQGSGKSTCEGECLAAWPPLVGMPTAGTRRGREPARIDHPHRRQHPGQLQRLAALLLGQGQGSGRHDRPRRERRLVRAGREGRSDQVALISEVAPGCDLDAPWGCRSGPGGPPAPRGHPPGAQWTQPPGLHRSCTRATMGRCC